MFRKWFGIENDGFASAIRHALGALGGFLAAMGLVGAEEWAVFSSSIDAIIGGVFAVYAFVMGQVSKWKGDPTPV